MPETPIRLSAVYSAKTRLAIQRENTEPEPDRSEPENETTTEDEE